MELNKQEKQEIFWALLDKYPNFERGRKQAATFFKGEKLKEAVDQIDEHEKKYYTLIKKFADETNTEMPEYKKP